MARTKRYDGTLELRPGGYRLIFRINGKRTTRRLHTTDRDEAERLAVDVYKAEVEAAARESTGMRTPRTFGELLENYSANMLPLLAPGTQDAYKDSFKPLREFFVDGQKNPSPRSITPQHVRQFLTWRRVNRRVGVGPVSNRTLGKDRTVLGTVFGYAVQQGFMASNPVARVPADKWDDYDPVILDPAQYAELLEKCRPNPMLYLYTLLLGETGMRAYSEALRLRWEDVDLREGFIRVRGRRRLAQDGRTKSGKGRWVPMSRALREAMQAHFAVYRFTLYDGERAAYIFHHTTTRRHHKAGAHIKDMRGAFDTAAARAKLPEAFRRHDLRHLRVTTWLREGKSPVKVKEAVGHADLKTTMKYTHLVRDDLRELVESPPVAAAAGKQVG